jgi:magnesium transporter
MSVAPGRSQARSHRRAQHEGILMRVAPGRSQARSHCSAQHEGILMSVAPGRSQARSHRSAQHEGILMSVAPGRLQASSHRSPLGEGTLMRRRAVPKANSAVRSMEGSPVSDGDERLLFAFLETHPADAARVLERLSPLNVAGLLSDAPVRLAGPALRLMLPPFVARCLDPLDDPTTLGLLRAMGPQAGVAVLHYLPEVRRSALLAQLPTAMGMAFRLLLGYPEDAVGAWMDPRVVVLPGDTTAQAALTRLRESQSEIDAQVFVTGAGQRLQGMAELPELLRAPADMPLSKLMRKVRFTLPARASIMGVGDHEGRDDYQLLPVVERDDRFVGALDRGVVARALMRRQRVRPQAGMGDVFANLAGGYWLGVSSLIQLAVEMLPVSAPLPPGEAHDHQY